jgi:hypothetical protein
MAQLVADGSELNDCHAPLIEQLVKDREVIERRHVQADVEGQTARRRNNDSISALPAM